MDEQNLSSKTTASRELRTIVSAVGMSYCLGRMSSDKGTGMGMSISYQIVIELHSGQLLCHTAPGAEATFTIQIPSQQAQLPEAAANGACAEMLRQVDLRRLFNKNTGAKDLFVGGSSLVAAVAISSGFFQQDIEAGIRFLSLLVAFIDWLSYWSLD